jgi:hypothetical protein
MPLAEDVSPANLQELNCDGVQAICVSYLEPGNPKNARYMARRLRKRMPDLPLIGNSLKLSAWAAIVFWLGTANVCAGITFCNKFSKTLFVAIAYPQDGGSWMSEAG